MFSFYFQLMETASTCQQCNISAEPKADVSAASVGGKISTGDSSPLSSNFDPNIANPSNLKT
jgi:hypothetical protein